MAVLLGQRVVLVAADDAVADGPAHGILGPGADLVRIVVAVEAGVVVVL